MAAATALAGSVVWFAPLDSVSAIYMLPVLMAAVLYGSGPAVAAALLGAVMTSLFYPPLFSVLVFRPAQLIDLVTSLLVALTVGQLASRLRRHMMDAHEKERQIRQIYALSRDIASARNVDSVLNILADHIEADLKRPIVLFVAAEGRTDMVRSAFDPSVTERVSQAAAGFLNPARDVTDFLDLPEIGRWLFCRVASGGELAVVLAAELPAQEQAGSAHVAALARSLLEEAAASLARLGVENVLEERRLRQRTDELRDILVEAVSHELRTPLAGILGSASVLGTAPAVAGSDALRDLAVGIEHEAQRLDRLIQNLLDLGRIRAGALQPKLDGADAVDIVNAAVEAAGERLQGRAVERSFADPLPFLWVDPVLISQALVNLLENAAKYTPPEVTIRISIRAEGDFVAVDVADEGPGIEAREAGHVFERFYRGERHADAVGGSGLGLTIARVFIEANGGRIVALSEGAGKGTTMRIVLPRTRANWDESHDD